MPYKNRSILKGRIGRKAYLLLWREPGNLTVSRLSVVTVERHPRVILDAAPVVQNVSGEIIEQLRVNMNYPAKLTAMLKKPRRTKICLLGFEPVKIRCVDLHSYGIRSERNEVKANV